MTSERRELDAALLLDHQPITLHRLARTKYANLSGAGAAARPGRWNLFGEEALYTSLETGTTLLERLVHTDKGVIPRNLSLMQILLSGKWQQLGELHEETSTGARMVILKSLKDANRFMQISRATSADPIDQPFAVAVPSVLVPVWNVVLFPRRRGFEWHVSIGPVEALELDSRLFPEGAMFEQ